MEGENNMATTLAWRDGAGAVHRLALSHLSLSALAPLSRVTSLIIIGRGDIAIMSYGHGKGRRGGGRPPLAAVRAWRQWAWRASAGGRREKVAGWRKRAKELAARAAARVSTTAQASSRGRGKRQPMAAASALRSKLSAAKTCRWRLTWLLSGHRETQANSKTLLRSAIRRGVNQAHRRGGGGGEGA